MSSIRLLNRLGELISRGEEMLKTFDKFPVKDMFGEVGELSLDNREKLDQWKLSCLNAIEIIAGKKSVFYETFPHKYIDYKNTTFDTAMSHYLSVLRALNEELQMGFLYGVEILVAKDMLSTIIEEAKALFQAKYKDAAAVYCRVILETAVKKLCDNNKTSYTKKEKLSSISNKLRKKGFLSLPEWRQIQVWTDIGNSAAHGNFSDYTEDNVKNMLNGIENFVEAKLK